MGRFFDQDSKVMTFFSRLADVAVLNVLFLLTSLPILTLGVSTTALYRALLNLVREEHGPAWKDYFRAFRSEWKPATLLFLVLLVPTALVTLNGVLLYAGALGDGAFVKIVCLFPAILLLLVASYAFPLTAQFQNSVLGTVKNAFLLSVGQLPRTVVIAALNLLPGLTLVLFPSVFLRLFPLWITVAFGGIAYLNTRLLLPVFDRLMAAKKPPEEAERA